MSARDSLEIFEDVEVKGLPPYMEVEARWVSGDPGGPHHPQSAPGYTVMSVLWRGIDITPKLKADELERIEYKINED